MRSPPIFEGTCISIHTITHQAAEALAGLGPTEARDLEVAATILDRSLAIGRPPSGRAERLSGSRGRLFELRITPPGRRGPHTRALYIREGRELLVVRVLRKAERGIPRRAIRAAEREAATWRGRGDEAGGSRGRTA
jgi:hypothetical protein